MKEAPRYTLLTLLKLLDLCSTKNTSDKYKRTHQGNLLALQWMSQSPRVKSKMSS